jgi:hypothetical protein
MAWHEDLRVEIAVEFQRLSSPPWDEESIWRAIQVGRIRWQEIPSWFAKTTIGRRLKADYAAHYRALLRRTMVAVRWCATCRKPFDVTAFRYWFGHGNDRTCSRRCAGQLASRLSGHALMVRIGKDERPLTEWCALKGISYRTVRSRMNRGMKAHEALRAPAGKPLCVSKTVTHRGVTLSLTGWAKRYGMSVQALRYRLKAGMPFAQAIAAPRMNRWTRNAA